MIYGWGLGGPGGRKQSRCPPLLPQGPGAGHRHPRLLKGNTDPSQNGKGGRDTSPAHTQAPAPTLFSSVRRQGLQATPCSFQGPTQARTLQDSAAHRDALALKHKQTEGFRTKMKRPRSCTVPLERLKCFSGLRMSKSAGGFPGLLSQPHRCVQPGSPAHSTATPTESLSKRQKEKIKKIKRVRAWRQGPPQPHYKLLQVSYLGK